jgi:hypothetical protein
MAYIGNQLTSTSFVVDTFSGTGSQTAFTGLTFAPASTAAISVYVAGVYQSPSSYTLSGTTLNFNSAPAVGTSNIQVLHLGTGATAGVPSDGSVSVAKMAANAITTSSIADANVTDAKIVAVANTKITGLVTASQIANVANTQVTGLITASQIANVANTQITGTMTIAQGGTGASSLANANIAVLNSAQTFTAAQRGTITVLTDGATITPDFAVTNNYSVTLGGNRTLANPTNITAGQSGSIFVSQDATGSRTLAYGTNWDFAGGTAPTLSTAASSVDRIDYVVRTDTSIHAVFTANYS